VSLFLVERLSIIVRLFLVERLFLIVRLFLVERLPLVERLRICFFESSLHVLCFPSGRKEIAALKVICPNAGCDEIVLRRQVEEHIRTTCQFTVLRCKHREQGCRAKVKRRDLEEHETDEDIHPYLKRTCVMVHRHNCDSTCRVAL
jgi:hypothetical protein